MKNTYNFLTKTLLLLVFLSGSISSAKACDICGCANGGSFFGILPQSHLQFMGVRYRVRAFDSHINSTLFRSAETYQTTELWGRFYPFKRTQVLAFLPYNFNQQTVHFSHEVNRSRGFGDASVLVQYNVFTTMFDSTARKLDHRILLGGGLKLPTGKFNTANSEVVNANFQLGTGSLDYLLNVIYTVRYANWGANLEGNYRIGTENAEKYRFANRTSVASSFFRSLRLNEEVTLLPNVGFAFEYSKADVKNGQRNEFTGGGVSNFTFGTELYSKRFLAGVAIQKPFYQTIANGDLKSKGTVSIHLTHLFKR